MGITIGTIFYFPGPNYSVQMGCMKKVYITVDDTPVEVWWKTVKRINLVVYAADARVRISVPLATSMHSVQRMIVERMGWIKAQQAKFRGRPRPVQLQFTEGESHLFLGEKYPLSIVEGGRRHFVSFDPSSGITLHLRANSTGQQRNRLLDAWYRQQLKQRIPALLKVWQPLVGEEVHEFRIKRMKTRWGTCNIHKRRIWLNLELIRKPEECLEYILVHEMVHLLEPHHNDRFYHHMDTLFPRWRSVDMLLKQEI